MIEVLFLIAAFGGLEYLAAALGLGLITCLVVLIRVLQSVRRMRTEQERAMRSLMDRRDQLEATLGSMVEAVMAVDEKQRIISLNDAAAELLDLPADRVIGRVVTGVIHHDPLRRFILNSLDSADPIQIQFDLTDPAANGPPAATRHFIAQATALKAPGGRRIGSLVTLADVTRLRHLEVVRRDFVANASHEIKTPVTAIKAAAETLEAAGPGDKDAADRFLPVIVRQADRLGAIIEDLLALTQIEQESENHRVELQSVPLANVLRAAAETCQDECRRKQAEITINCPPDVTVEVNPHLLEQALVNLVGNAIKYSPPGQRVEVSAAEADGKIVLAVRDHGPGIAPDHLPRLFERFYRTDKARSREMGGTGLGLAIVKHIATAHGGRVSVESRPGEGSTFRIHLPAS